MKENQISLSLAMRQMRFFNERPGSTKNNNRFFKRMWVMYPKTTEQVFKMPYEHGMTEGEYVYRKKPMHHHVNPLKH